MSMTTEQKVQFQKAVIESQQKALNVFDDFFEYRYKNYDMEDARDYAYRTLNHLQYELSKLRDAYGV